MCSYRGGSLQVGFMKWQSGGCSNYGKYRCRQCRKYFCGKHIHQSDDCVYVIKKEGTTMGNFDAKEYKQPPMDSGIHARTRICNNERDLQLF